MDVKKTTITINSKDAKLVGDIYLPQPEKRKTGEDTRAIIIETGLTLNRHGIFADFARYFATNGIAAFVYDKRSHNDSSGEFRCELLKEDTLSVVDHLARELGIKNFGIFGFCFGGIPAMEATAISTRINVFCGVNTYAEYLPMVLANKKSLPFRLWALHKTGQYMQKLHLLKHIPIKTTDFHTAHITEGIGFKGDLSRFFEELHTCQNPLPNVRKIRKPFFLFYAEKDRMVPPAAAQKILAACPSKIKKIYTYEGADHFFRTKREEMLRDCLEIYKKYL